MAGNLPKLGAVGALRCTLDTQRLQHQLSVRELAEQTNIKAHVLVGIQRGERTPSRTEIEQLTGALGCTLEDLYPDEDVRTLLLAQPAGAAA